MNADPAAAVPTRTLSSSFWPADRSTALADYTVGQLLVTRAAEHPDREALVGVRHGSGAPERLTYSGLLDEARRVAAALGGLTEPGSFVALWAPNVVEWTIIQYGAALAGMVLVALSPALPDDDLDYALRHCGATVLLHAETGRDDTMGQTAARVCAAIPAIRRISLSNTALWRAQAPAAIPDPPGDPDTAVMLQYTSGTTGRPKGVLLTHRALVNVAKLTMAAAGVPPGAVCLNPLPLFHTAGCVIATLGPLWVGVTAILCERFAAEPVLATLRGEGATVLFYVPAVLHALLAAQRSGPDPAPQLAVILGGASIVPAELIDGAAEVFGADVLNLFGQTELAPVLSCTRPADSRSDRLATVGRPLPHVDCKVIDPDSGRVLPIGDTGEICARGYQQFVGYLHDPEATAAALDAEGYVRTGDLGTMDARGFLTVTGRLKELIIRGGENIAPVAVEQVLGQHDSVTEAVVIGLPDERLGEIVAAVCRFTDARAGAVKADLVAHARRHLAAHTVPARWFAVDAFPMTPTSKVRRFELREAIRRGDLDEL